jgi:hypothetical protein
MNHELILVTLAGVGGTIAAIIGGFTLTLVIDISKETTKIIAALMKYEDQSSGSMERFHLKVKHDLDRYRLETIRTQVHYLTVSLMTIVAVVCVAVFLPMLEMADGQYSERDTRRILLASLISFAVAFTWLIGLAGGLSAAPVFEVDDAHNLTRSFLQKRLLLGRPGWGYILTLIAMILEAVFIYKSLY